MKITNTIKVVVLFILTNNFAYGLGTNSENRLERVTVTANKIEENIQDVPQSITVIDAEIIEQKGIKNVEDILREIPNMTGVPDHGMMVNFRGLNASMFTNNNPIVLYIDGIPTSNRYAFEASLENVERIEVLRGPQGTLYGKDAIGGVISIITKKPTNETSGSVGVEYGDNNYKRGTFNINTPFIKDKLFFNFNADINSDDGWITNKYNNDDKFNKLYDKKFGASLYYNITDKLSAKLALKKEIRKDYGEKAYGIVGAATLGQFSREKAENLSYDMPSYEEQTINSQSLNIKYEADDYTIQSVSVHRKSDLDGIYDADFNSGTPYDKSTMFNSSSTKNYSQELRVLNNAIDNIRWVSGIYYNTEEHKQGPYGQDYKYFGAPMMYGNAVSSTDSDTQAIFGQTMIPLNKQFELTLGGRYQKVKKQIDMTVYENKFGTSGSFDFDAQKTWNVFLPKVALSYKIKDNLTSFASISQGYMPGGFNFYASSTNTQENSFEPQKSTNYETGIKGTLDNLTYTASIFKMYIKDIHVYRQVGGNYYTDNADKGHSEGIEFDFTYFPVDTIEVSGAVGFIKTKYDSYKVGNLNFTGEKIETTPSHSANLGIAYHHPQGFYARTDIKNQGSMTFYDDAAKTFQKHGGYTLVDVKLGYKFSNWDIYTYGKNITDKKYINTFRANAQFSNASYGDPRFFGMGVKYTF